MAGVAFLVTRVVVVGTVRDAGAPPALAAARFVPLVLGLGLVVAGVGLAVSDWTHREVRLVAGWYLAGSAVMALTAGVGAIAAGYDLAAFDTTGVVANVVVGGGSAGLLVGIYAVRARRERRRFAREADRSVLLNRMLRHEALNALTAIRGHADLLADGSGTTRSRSAVVDGTDRIERAVEDVGRLVRRGGADGRRAEPVALDEVLESCRDALSTGDRSVRVEGSLPSVAVRADDDLGTAFEELVDLALDRAADPHATLSVTADRRSVAVTVAAPGAWLTDAERTALHEGLPEFDAPEVRYGVPIVRLLVDGYGGRLDATDDADGTAVTVTLPRPRAGGGEAPLASVGVGGRTLGTAALAGLVAGVGMGWFLQVVTGSLGVIGALYGVRAASVGWVAHLFHSLVFAVVFVAARSRLPRATAGLASSVGLGLGYGVLLWVVAAGAVMRLWLASLGVTPPVPPLSLPGLLAHLVWGALVGAVVALLD